MEENLSYSVLEIAGHILIGAIFIASIFTGLKYISAANQSVKIQGLILLIIMILPIVLFVGLTYLNKAIDTPSIQFGNTASLIIGIVSALFIIGMSLWAKTWILIIIVALLTIPDYLLGLTPLKYETQQIVSPWIPFVGIAIYFYISSKWKRNM